MKSHKKNKEIHHINSSSFISKSSFGPDNFHEKQKPNPKPTFLEDISRHPHFNPKINNDIKNRSINQIFIKV